MALVLLKASESTGLEHQESTDLLRSPQNETPQITPLRADSHELKIHTEALRAAEEFTRSESALIDALMAADRAQVFVKFGYPSLFKYAVEALKLSEPTAYNCITVARKSLEVPALQESIAAGTISVSKAKKIAAVLTPANQSEWIEKAQTLSSRQLEKEVARENPRLTTPERATYVSGKRLELTLGVEEALMLKIRRAQDQVRLRDQGQCQFKALKQSDALPSICGSRRWTDLHHIQPLCEDGAHTLDNLITLCRAHHQHTHRRP